MKLLYLFINFFTVIIPFVFSFHPRLQFYKTWKYFLPATVISAIIFLAWDSIFVRKGIWGFNEKYISGIFIGNIPVEEMLFFICIPYACVFTYHCLSIMFDIQWKTGSQKIAALILAIVLATTGIMYYNRLYTSVTFISTALLLLIFQFYFQITWFGKFVSTYIILLIPFLIVNGILTGTGLAEPVVWYNNAENSGIRIGTIPVEDIFYGFELILLNIFLFEIFKNRNPVARSD